MLQSALFYAAVAAQSLRGVTRVEEDQGKKYEAIFWKHGHPTMWFWVAIGVVVLLLIILIACCCGSSSASKRDERLFGKAHDVWMGFGCRGTASRGRQFTTKDGKPMTFQGALVKKIQTNHPSHQDGQGLLENDDLRQALVEGKLYTISGRDDVGKLKGRAKIGGAIVLTIYRLDDRGAWVKKEIKVQVLSQADNLADNLNVGYGADTTRTSQKAQPAEW